MKSFKIQNFQTHKKIKIDLTNPITTIVGASDSGKSSIIRALKWLMTNNLKGTSFIKKGKEFTKIILEVDDKKIIRKRSDSINSYKMNDQEYRAFGNDVPIDIAEVLNINYLNFQDQHDSPFWFSETAGEVSRQLNKIVDLSKIDSTMKAIDGMTKEAKIEVEVLKEREEKSKKERKNLKWSKEAHRELYKIEEINSKLNLTKDLVLRINSLITIIVTYTSNIDLLREVHSRASKILQKGENYKKIKNQKETLYNKINLIKILKNKVKRPLPPNITNCDNILNNIYTIKKKKESLKVFINKIRRGEELLCHKLEEQKQIQKNFKNKMGDRCPLCNSKIK